MTDGNDIFAESNPEPAPCCIPVGKPCSHEVTDNMVERAVKAHWGPRLHVNDSHHDRRIDMRAALEAALNPEGEA